MEKEFRKYLNNIIGTIVTHSRAGGGAGSIILMDLDKDGIVYTLWIGCNWRIENDSQIVATSTDDITPNTGLVAQSTRMFEGRQVVSFELSKFNDLFIGFSDNLYLRIFNDASHSNTGDYNWKFWIPSEELSFTVTNNFDIKKGIYH